MLTALCRADDESGFTLNLNSNEATRKDSSRQLSLTQSLMSFERSAEVPFGSPRAYILSEGSKPVEGLHIIMTSVKRVWPIRVKNTKVKKSKRGCQSIP